MAALLEIGAEVIPEIIGASTEGLVEEGAWAVGEYIDGGVFDAGSWTNPGVYHGGVVARGAHGLGVAGGVSGAAGAIVEYFHKKRKVDQVVSEAIVPMGDDQIMPFAGVQTHGPRPSGAQLKMDKMFGKYFPLSLNSWGQRGEGEAVTAANREVVALSSIWAAGVNPTYTTNTVANGYDWVWTAFPNNNTVQVVPPNNVYIKQQGGSSQGTNVSMASIIGQTPLASIKDQQWLELKYDKLVWECQVPQGLPDVKVCVYWLLVPLNAGNSSGLTIGGTNQLAMQTNDLLQTVNDTLSQGFFQRNLPNRFYPAKGEIKVCGKVCITFPKEGIGIESLNPYAAPPTPPGTTTQYILPTFQRRKRRVIRHNYNAGKGLRFYCTNQASTWLTWVPPNTFCYFVGGDRTIPVLPCRVCSYSCLSSTPGTGTGNPLADTSYVQCVNDMSMYTWYRIENQGQF